jgi:flagellar biosynthesis protein FliQ
MKKKAKLQKKRLGFIPSIIYVFKVIMFLATQTILNKNSLKMIKYY